MHHPELDRARALVRVLCDGTPFEEATVCHYRKSIHLLRDRSSHEWLREVSQMLKACDRLHEAERLLTVRVIANSLPTAHIEPASTFIWRERATLRGLDNPLLCEALRRRLRLFYSAFRAVEKWFCISVGQAFV